MDRVPSARGMAFARAMPRIVLWAWEEPEDLRSADVRTVGVAYLAESILLGNGEIGVRPRRQPLLVAPGAAVMAVVRMETARGYRDSRALREQAAAELAAAARRPGTRALQVDFDAGRSQQEFYAAVLRRVRAEMPPGMPLSITALASWCGSAPGWLGDLPIDEAVPMFFRLGGRAQPYADKRWIAVREPLCRGSAGLSVDESWPDVDESARVYLFAPRPWSEEQIAAAAELPGSGRVASLRVLNHGVGDLRSRSNGSLLGAQEDGADSAIPEEQQ